jgi:hypothetical protein
MTTPTVRETTITREGARIMPDHITTADAPTIERVRKSAGIAGQYAVTARVRYPGEPARDVTFIGSVYGGPVIMRTEVSRNVSTLEEAQWWETKTVETFVTDPARFGEFGEAWVRAFFAAS